MIDALINVIPVFIFVGLIVVVCSGVKSSYTGLEKYFRTRRNIREPQLSGGMFFNIITTIGFILLASVVVFFTN